MLGWRRESAYLPEAMTRCLRCSIPATSLLTYDHGAAEAYLTDARGDEAMYEGIALCETHAGRFSPPVGWALVDRRHRDITLFALREVG